MDGMLTHMDKNTAVVQPLCTVLQRVMTAKNITTHGLAVRTGISSTTLQRRFAGSPFTLDELFAIAAALGTPASELMRRAEASLAQPAHPSTHAERRAS